jgi:alpha-glucosidase
LGGDAALIRLALVLLFAYPGTPCLYYGDEIGLGGGPDPDNRRPMVWDPARHDTDRLALVKSLVRLRRTSPALARGGFVELLISEECFAFARIFAGETMLCIVRRAATPGETSLPISRLGAAGVFRDTLSGAAHPVRQGRLVLDLPPVAGLILRAE